MSSDLFAMFDGDLLPPPTSSIKKENVSADGTPKDPPKRRGRKPKPKPDGIQIQDGASSSSAIPDKPKRPRQPETKKRQPYKTKRALSMEGILSEMREMNVKSEFEEIAETPVTSGQIKPEPRRNEDLVPIITEKLFNQRMVRHASNADKAATNCFRIIENMMRNANPGSYDHKMLTNLEKNIRIMRNDTVSLKTGLAHLNTLLMRGKAASKGCAIPIQTPWRLRTETLNNQKTDWEQVQTDFNDFWVKHVLEMEPHDDEEELTDGALEDKLLRQKASSVFLGRGSNDIPSYIYNSDHLITRTGSGGRPDIILVGGGDPDTLQYRTHTVIASFCNDLNVGLSDFADLPEEASSSMVPDTAETGVNAQDDFPIGDPAVYR